MRKRDLSAIMMFSSDVFVDPALGSYAIITIEKNLVENIIFALVNFLKH